MFPQNLKICPKCKHFLYLHNDENSRSIFKCWERNSNENNDFCGCTYGKPEPVSLELYVVKNSKGEYFRAKGFGGGGKSWVENISQAKIYTKIGQAKARVTYFTKHNPDNLPSPKIITLEAHEK
jgi:hypothetical protein